MIRAVRVPHRLLACVVFLLALAGCAGGNGSSALAQAYPAASGGAPKGAYPANGSLAPACPDAPGPIGEALVFGMDNNLYAISPSGGSAQQLTNVSNNVYATDPAWSPDGQTLAYTLAMPASDPNLSWLPVGVICGLDRATGKARLLAKGAAPLDGLTEATWTPDARALIVTMHQPRLDANQAYVGTNVTIMRYDLAGGAAQVVVKDGLNPTLTPDGKQLAFVQLNPTDLSTTLMLARADGQAATPLPPVDPPLDLIVGPRYSPDGRQIVFAATGGVQDAPSGSVGRRSWLEQLLGVQVASAHGPPSNLWLVDSVGQPPRRLTDFGLDDPRMAWSPDGTKIVYTHGFGGVFVYDLASRENRQISPLGNYGGITWTAK